MLLKFPQLYCIIDKIFAKYDNTENIMKLQYLGTAAAEAIPGVFCTCRFCLTARRLGGKEIRLRSGAVIDGELLIDLSPDIYTASMRAGVCLSDIKNIIFTHSHPDHCYANELANRRHGYCYLPEDTEPLHTYGCHGVEKRIDSVLPNLTDHGVDFTYLPPFEPTLIGSHLVTALPALHHEDSYIYLIERDGKRIIYGHDTGMFTPETTEYLKNRRCDLVSLDCTMGYQPTEAHHMGFAANVKMKNILIENKTADENTIFISNHFSHNGLRSPDGDLTYDAFSDMCKKHGFIMSYDTMTVEL